MENKKWKDRNCSEKMKRDKTFNFHLRDLENFFLARRLNEKEEGHWGKLRIAEANATCRLEKIAV